MKKRLATLGNLLFAVLLLGVMSWQREGRLPGHSGKTEDKHAEGGLTEEQLGWASSVLPDCSQCTAGGKLFDSKGRLTGYYRLTLPCAPEVQGFAGPVPALVILDRENVVRGVFLLPNQETPGFLSQVVESGLLKKWNGRSAAEGVVLPVDAVSGATYSSRAIIQSVRAGLAVQAQVELQAPEPEFHWSRRQSGGLLAILGALFCCLSGMKRPGLRKIQLGANFVLLGVVSGSFVSLSGILSLIAGGSWLNGSLVPLLVLLAVVLPVVLGRKVYCVWFCPLGSIQELLGQTRVKKLKTPKILNHLRSALAAVLFLLWCFNLGWTALDFELFPGMIWGSVQLGLRLGLVAVLILAVWIPRPYCRFLCPTGALLDFIASPFFLGRRMIKKRKE